MVRIVIMLVGLGFLGCLRTVQTPGPIVKTTKQIVQESKPAIVRIETKGQNGDGVGTGFVLSADGRIATNLHVIQGATEIRVRMLTGETLLATKVMAIDPKRDLAVILVPVSTELSTLPLGDSSIVEAGDPVIAIGNPLGVLDYTVSDGLISSVRPVNRELTILQISAPISQGSSGGPLFNERGEVIGIATAIFTEGQNLNFGVPSNYLAPMLRTKLGMSLAAYSEIYRQTMDHTASYSQEAPRQQDTGRAKSIHNTSPQDLTMLAHCSDQSVVAAFRSIRRAITKGAPMYNDGHHEQSFRVYESTAISMEAKSPCSGIRDAVGQGLLRAASLPDYSEKAWAMRDAFDRVVRVIIRRAQSVSSR